MFQSFDSLNTFFGSLGYFARRIVSDYQYIGIFGDIGAVGCALFNQKLDDFFPGYLKCSGYRKSDILQSFAISSDRSSKITKRHSVGF